MTKRLVVLFAVTVCVSVNAGAVSSYLDDAKTKYPSIVGTYLASCKLCHTTTPSRNSYGKAFGSNDHSFDAIANLDSDGDGVTNVEEIQAGTWPGSSSQNMGCACTGSSSGAKDLQAAYGELVSAMGCQPANQMADKNMPFHDSAGNLAMFGGVFGILAYKGRRK